MNAAASFMMLPHRDNNILVSCAFQLVLELQLSANSLMCINTDKLCFMTWDLVIIISYTQLPYLSQLSIKAGLVADNWLPFLCTDRFMN